jgi:hypothetical protein
VANIAGTVHDTIGEVHSYPGGHYLTVFGYSENGEHASIADSADRAGSPEYQVSVADWPSGSRRGAIRPEWTPA